jgi:predicted ATP-dependent protease
MHSFDSPTTSERLTGAARVRPREDILRELRHDELCRRCDPLRLGFETTSDLPDLDDALGQNRAIEAIRFGVGMERAGYNLFAMGPEGVGRHTAVHRFLEQQAASQAVPAAWCYVNNFESPHKPRALQFPAGLARKFAHDMARLVEDLRSAIPAAFETDEYRMRRQEIETEFGEHQEQAVSAVEARARKDGIALLRTPAGFGFAPVRDDEVMTPQEFHKLPEAEQKRLEQAIAALQEELEAVLHEVPKWRREAQHRLRELNRQVISVAVNSLIEELVADYQALPHVRNYLKCVQEDVLNHAEQFQKPKEGEQPMLFRIPLPQRDSGETALQRYRVNVLIDHADRPGAPVIYEDNPTHDNLVGRIEHESQMGALLTDFTMIKAGALHRANGGYLMLDARKVLSSPLAWEALKRALRASEVRIESLGQALSLISTSSLEPEPITLQLKVVLVGQRLLYYLLHAYDPEFGELFKVQVDFEEDMERNGEGDLQYARLLATLARKEKLKPFDRTAVARIIEFGSRAAGDAEKLSVHAQDLVDLLCESDFCAGKEGRTVVTVADVQRALELKERRADRVRARLQEQVLRGTVLIDSGGWRSGQINALSLMQLGRFAFGMPHRITARARMGSGKVIDIEREAQLGGPIHSKGVLILSGFLAGRYAISQPLSLSASLVFEQSYGGVEGDSASSAELYALLSALADVPIRQSLAVTGSVNQHGDVQAIGGASEKIEGFFAVCRARGLTGEQGVLIPASNVKHLALCEDVVKAVAAGQFHVYPVATVDQGIEILTGLPAGERDAAGQYPIGTVNHLVERRLAQFAERLRAMAGGAAARKPWRGPKTK